jgi:outer membrane lipoprotein-sorting protein
MQHKMLLRLVIILPVFLLCSSLWAIPSVTEILEAIDESMELGQDITCKVKITQQKVDQGVKVMESIYYRRDSDDAFLIVMTAPDSDKGDGYLRVGDNMWMYLRNTRTFQHMNRDDEIGGSDLSAGDMEQRKYTELYEPALDENGNEIISEETLGSAGIPVYRFEIIAKVNDVKYHKLVMWVTRDEYLTMMVESYSLSGTLMETSYYKQYTDIDGHYIPLWMLFVDKFEEGNKSLVELSGISLKAIDNTVFTKTYLENLSR